MRSKIEFAGLLAICLVLALWLSVKVGSQIDGDAYDTIFRMYRPPDWPQQSIVLGIDEESLHKFGGFPGLRKALAEGLERIAPAAPKAVAIDVTLADSGTVEDDERLEAAIRHTPHVVLGCYLRPGKQGPVWEDPLPPFSHAAEGVGHAHVDTDPVCRQFVPEKVAGKERRWALALEAWRVGSGKLVRESNVDAQFGAVVIPALTQPLWIRYEPPDRPIRTISLTDLLADPQLAKQFAGKTVFFGATAQTAEDKQPTPYTNVSLLPMPGVEIHANIFETIANKLFLSTASDATVLAFCILLAAMAGAAFAFRSGWQSYALGVSVITLSIVAPYFAFTRGFVVPFTPLVFSAALSVGAAAAYQYFIVRKRMLTAEGDKTRYQQAMHFVTHEMRTPLTAIQGSSELIGRYALTEDKRKQMAQLINSESKRLGRMIEIFLSVERLSAGQIELKKEQFDGMDLMSTCVERVRPLAERKQIVMRLDPGPEAPLIGDRELMEYAFYNLLTNAVKYSPSSTQVTVYSQRDGERVRISVKDQGIGMDQKEVRKIFQKFYRTKKAEESGEVGTGIGLSIVEQIITQHGGSIEVTSSPGRGSCFTLVLATHKASMVESN